MEPITTAIVAALTARVASSVPKAAEKVVIDAYEGLKAIIKQKFGSESKISRAITDLEEDPESKGYTAVLEEQVTKVKADQDPEILQAAQNLLNQINAQPGGEQHIQTITGNYNAQADRGSTANVHVNKSKD